MTLGARFSKVPRGFRTRKVKAKSQTLSLPDFIPGRTILPGMKSGNLQGYSHIVNMSRSSLHTRRLRRIHLSVLRCRLPKNGFAGAKSFRTFWETGRKQQHSVTFFKGGRYRTVMVDVANSNQYSLFKILYLSSQHLKMMLCGLFSELSKTFCYFILREIKDEIPFWVTCSVLFVLVFMWRSIVHLLRSRGPFDVLFRVPFCVPFSVKSNLEFPLVFSQCSVQILLPGRCLILVRFHSCAFLMVAWGFPPKRIQIDSTRNQVLKIYLCSWTKQTTLWAYWNKIIKNMFLSRSLIYWRWRWTQNRKFEACPGCELCGCVTNTPCCVPSPFSILFSSVFLSSSVVVILFFILIFIWHSCCAPFSASLTFCFLFATYCLTLKWPHPITRDRKLNWLQLKEPQVSQASLT